MKTREKHAERRAELADRLRAMLLSDEDAADVVGERDSGLGITVDLLRFVDALETLAVPPPGDVHPPLTRWQVAHTKAVLAKSPHLAQLNSTLCPAKMSETAFWVAYFEACGERIVPNAPPSPAVMLSPPGEQAASRDDDRGDVHTLVAAADASPPPAAAEAHAGEGEGALEDFLTAVLTPGDADADDAEAGGDEALEAEFAEMLRGETESASSSLSLESVSEAEAK